MPILLGLSYLVIRLGFTTQLDSLGAYSSYVLEIVCVMVIAASRWRVFLAQFALSRSATIAILLSLPCGYAVHKGLTASNILIPFDLTGAETIFFLLLVGPILEELIFRFFLWQSTQDAIQKFFRERSINRYVPFVFTTLLFSYSHLHSIWYVPEDFHPFIYFQTLYTAGLGIACGYFVVRLGSLTSAILIHFGFNLGFYFGSQF